MILKKNKHKHQLKHNNLVVSHQNKKQLIGALMGERITLREMVLMNMVIIQAGIVHIKHLNNIQKTGLLVSIRLINVFVGNIISGL